MYPLNVNLSVGSPDTVSATIGEIVIVVAGANNNDKKNDLPDLVFLLRDALRRLSLRDAVNEVSILTGASKKHIYQNALDIINDKPEYK